MRKLIDGISNFRNRDFGPRAELFQYLAKGQEPDTLFITCSDSRIDPNLLTQSEPGELFIVRNAGNIIPPHGAGTGGEGATIEFALTVLGVKEIVICGHSGCGAMKSLLNPETLGSLPTVASWLSHAQATRTIIDQNYSDVTDKEELLAAATEENVLVQLENLKTLPAVAVGLSSGEITLHGWVYKIGTGEVFAYDREKHDFVPIDQFRVPHTEGKVRRLKVASQ